MIRLDKDFDFAMAYSAIRVLPEDVCAQIKTCWWFSTRIMPRCWKGSNWKGKVNAKGDILVYSDKSILSSIA